MSADFNGVARLYRYLEYSLFGPALWRRRIAYLPKLLGARRVLMAGEGDGRFLAAFLEANPEAAVDYLDASSAMLELARRRVPVRAEGRVRFVRADVLQTNFDGRGYDAIVTHFFFDCFCDEELRAVGERLAAARGGGLDLGGLRVSGEEVGTGPVGALALFLFSLVDRLADYTSAQPPASAALVGVWHGRGGGSGGRTSGLGGLAAGWRSQPKPSEDISSPRQLVSNLTLIGVRSKGSLAVRHPLPSGSTGTVRAVARCH
jgi:SAM-dependent methyltransferase